MKLRAPDGVNSIQLPQADLEVKDGFVDLDQVEDKSLRPAVEKGLRTLFANIGHDPDKKPVVKKDDAGGNK